jgi:predicted enzyme involved in methoxymalonyl-ACP biosynthesis
VAEPVEEPLQCWLREMGVTAAISFAPYNQVFQQLLDPSSLQATNQNGVNVALARLEDWYGKPVVAPTDESPTPDPHEELKRNVVDFLAGVVELRKRNAAPLVVILCPPSPSIADSIRESNSLAEMEEWLASELSRMSAVEIVTSGALLSLYPLADYHDPHGSLLADIPYAPPFYTALSMMIARKLHKLKLPQRKVIVLDCDNTLWSGVVGEDGCAGISFEPFRKILQECVLAQQRRGMLVALWRDKTFPALDWDGMYRSPSVTSTAFGDVSLFWYMNQGDRPAAATRGHLMDHIALSVADLDGWIAKLRAAQVTFLEPPYRLGDFRAVMIEGPSREAIELVEIR